MTINAGYRRRNLVFGCGQKPAQRRLRQKLREG